MLIVLLGALGFLFGMLFDWVLLLKRQRLKSALWVTCNLLLIGAHIAAVLQPDRIPMPMPVRLFGWILIVPAFPLLLYSLFFEIPLQNTYMPNGAGPELLVKEGTYALTRHPGVLWYAFLVVGLILISGSTTMLIAAPVWLLMNILWVWFEDFFVFDRLFLDYPSYRRTTPMLIPTVKSAKACWRSLVARHVICGSFWRRTR